MSLHVSTTPLRQLAHDLQPRVCVPIATVQAQPDPEARCTSEALYGEVVQVLSQHGDWLAIRQRRDGYEGYIEARHLTIPATVPATPLAPANTHWVTQRSTLLFEQADLKSPLRHRLPFGAELALVDTVTDTFSLTACGYHVWTAHCLSLEEHLSAGPLASARSLFLGSPYLWGGCTPQGIDCSGLIQALARSQGISLPRDSADQEAFLSTDVETDDYRPTDIVFWPGHTGILVSPTEILHATAHSLSCVIEPLADVILRAGPVSSVKRVFPTLLQHPAA